jgi:hypothetical protein
MDEILTGLMSILARIVVTENKPEDGGWMETWSHGDRRFGAISAIWFRTPYVRFKLRS